MKIPDKFFMPRVIGYFIFSVLVFVVFGLLTEMRMGNLQSFLSTDLAKQVSFEHFSVEDGPVEWATVVFALGACILLTSAYIQCRKLGLFNKPWDHVFLLLLIISLFFYAGEEISWGQRLLGFGTPESFFEINKQEEFNLHNIGILHYYKDGVFTIAIFLWGVILPMAKVLFPYITRLQQRIMLPVPPLEYVPLFAAALGFRVVFKTLYGNFGQELLEMMFSVAIFFVAWRAMKHPRVLYE